MFWSQFRHSSKTRAEKEVVGCEPYSAEQSRGDCLHCMEVQKLTVFISMAEELMQQRSLLAPGNGFHHMLFTGKGKHFIIVVYVFIWYNECLSSVCYCSVFRSLFLQYKDILQNTRLWFLCFLLLAVIYNNHSSYPVTNKC